MDKQEPRDGPSYEAICDAWRILLDYEDRMGMTVDDAVTDDEDEDGDKEAA